MKNTLYYGDDSDILTAGIQEYLDYYGLFLFEPSHLRSAMERLEF